MKKVGNHQGVLSMPKLVVLTICVLLITVLVAVGAQDADANPYDYEVVAQLGEGRIGNAAFSPDSSQLAVATSTGIEIYDLTTSDLETSTSLDTGALFVAFSEDGDSLIYLEPIRFAIGEGVYRVGSVTAFNIWQADTDNLQTAEMIGTIGVDIRFDQIPNFSVDDSVWQAVEDAIGMELWEPDHTDEDGETLISPDSRWAWHYYNVREDHRFDNNVQETTWYEVIQLEDDAVVVSSLEGVERLGISLKTGGHLLWENNTELHVIESLRCGTGISWDVTSDDLSELAGYGGCGDNRSCPTPFGDFCMVIGSQGATPRDVDRSDITVFSDMDNPDEDKEAFEFVAEGHTNTVLFLSGFYPDTVMSGSFDGTAIIWDTTASEDDFSMESYLQLDHAYPVTYVGYGPDESIMTASGGDIYFWDENAGALLTQLEGHNEPIMRVAWSPDGERFATSSADGVVLVWERKNN
jgi:WD40 repeat protein